MIAFAATTAGSSIADGTTDQLFGIFELIVTRIPLWITAFIVLVLSLLAAKIARSIVQSKLADSGVEDEHEAIQALGGRIAYAVVLTIGVTVAFKIAGIDLTTIIAAIAFGLGFALQDLIMNFLAGIMVVGSRHFTIGDFIEVNGTLGRVVEIQSRNTVLQGTDGTKIIVPNADLFKNKVTSFTSNPFRRIEVEVGVDYRANLENALKVCDHVTKNTKGILLEPKPYVIVSEWGDSEIVIKIRAWVESRGGWLKIKSHLLTNLTKAFNDYHIDIAWPIVQMAYDKEIEHAKDKLFEEKKPEKEIKVTAQIPVPAPIKPAYTAEATDLDTGEPLRPLAETNSVNTKK